MKKLFLLFLLSISIIGCKKTSTTPNPTTNKTTTPPPSTLNSCESLVMGKWYLKEESSRDSINHNYGTLGYYNSSNYFLDLQGSTYTDSSGNYTVTGYHGVSSNSQTNCINVWTANNDTVNFLSPFNGSVSKYKIFLITSDSLILQQGGVGANSFTIRWYFHK